MYVESKQGYYGSLMSHTYIKHNILSIAPPYIYPKTN